MPNDEFMDLVRLWRAGQANLQDAYVAAIPRHVADSMAFEGERVDLAFLQENLASA
jgi:hypothetical protein